PRALERGGARTVREARARPRARALYARRRAHPDLLDGHQDRSSRWHLRVLLAIRSAATRPGLGHDLRSDRAVTRPGREIQGGVRPSRAAPLHAAARAPAGDTRPAEARFDLPLPAAIPRRRPADREIPRWRL